MVKKRWEKKKWNKKYENRKKKKIFPLLYILNVPMICRSGYGVFAFSFDYFFVFYFSLSRLSCVKGIQIDVSNYLWLKWKACWMEFLSILQYALWLESFTVSTYEKERWNAEIKVSNKNKILTICWCCKSLRRGFLEKYCMKCLWKWMSKSLIVDKWRIIGF